MNFLDRCCIGNKRTAVHQHKVLKTHHKYRTSSRYSTAHGKISARHFRHGQINHIRTRGNRSGNTAWIGYALAQQNAIVLIQMVIQNLIDCFS